MHLDHSKIPLLSLFLAASLLLESPATRAAQHLSPIAETPVLAQTTQERQAEADRLYQQAYQQFQISQFQDAIESWEQALVIYREIGNVSREAAAINNLGNVYRTLGQYERAIESIEQALAIFQDIDDVAGVAYSLDGLGTSYLLLGQYERAITCLERALALKQDIGDVAGEAHSLMGLGLVYRSLSQYEQALALLEQALVIFQEIDHAWGEAASIHNLGLVYSFLGEYERAIDFFGQSLDITREIGDVAGVAISLNNLGNAYRNRGEYERAIEFHQQSLAIKREIGDLAGVADSLTSLGNDYLDLGRYEKAIEFHQQSLAIQQEIGDLAGVAISLNNLGNAYRNRGEYERAIEFHQQSLAIKREIGDLAGVAGSLNNLANVYFSLGQYERAIEFHQQSLAIQREIGDVVGEAQSLINLANVYFSLGQYEKAIEVYQQSLAIQQTIGDRLGQAKILGNLANVYFSLGQYEKAIEVYQQSLTIQRDIGNVVGEAVSLNGLGIAYRNLGEYERAIEFHQQSLAIKREIGDVAGIANSLLNLGNTYLNIGEYERAIEFHQQSLAIQQEIGNVAGIANSLNNLAWAFMQTQNFAAAEENLFATIELWETLRADLTNDEDKVSIFDTQINSYRSLQRVLIAQNKTEMALEISERGRARAFVELMAQRLQVNSAEAFVPPAPPTLADIQQVARTQNATLVEYSIVSLRDLSKTLYIWVVQPNGDIAFRQVNLDGLNISLAELVTESRHALGVRDAAIVVEYLSPEEIAARQANRLQQLHQLLIEPIADLLPTNPEAPVIFIPHRELFLVPFPALQDANGTYLIDKHTPLTAPAIQVLELTQRRGNGETLRGEEILVVGNPEMPSLSLIPGEPVVPLSSLPGAEREATIVAELLETEALIGSAATETTVRERMDTASIIHLATHGILDEFRGIGSSITLTPDGEADGFLTAEEILEMNLDAELVVLSACDTGRGKLTGDGVVGLSRSLVTAGVKSVVVSLWQVPDAPTADLMAQFYKNLQQGLDKGQALRTAMLSIRATHPEPRNWAAFTLMGNR